jgi:hypothetical protein
MAVIGYSFGRLTSAGQALYGFLAFAVLLAPYAVPDEALADVVPTIIALFVLAVDFLRRNNRPPAPTS